MRLAQLGASPVHSGQGDIVSRSTYRLLFPGYMGDPHNQIHPWGDWEAQSVLERSGKSYCCEIQKEPPQGLD